MRPATPAATAGWILLTFSCFYFLGLGGHIYSYDGAMMLRVTRSIAEHGRFDIQRHDAWLQHGGKEVADAESGDRRFYAWYGLAPSLAAVPAYLVGTALLPLSRPAEQDIFDRYRASLSRPGEDPGANPIPLRFLWHESGPSHFREAFLAFAASWTSPVIAAATLSGLFLLGIALGFSRRAALFLTLAVGLGTPVWAYSKEFFSEPLAALAVVWFLYFAVRGSQPGARTWNWAFAGLAVGLAVLAKVAHLVLLAPAGLLVLASVPRRTWREAVAAAGAFGLAAASALALIGIYNWARFGTPFETGYSTEVSAASWRYPFLKGIAGMLACPGRGLLVYSPLTLVAVAAAPRFARRCPRVVWFAALSLLALLAFYGSFQMWWGGWCWGPRYLVPVIPVLALPAIVFFEELPRRPWARTVLLLALGVSFAIALSGTFVSFNDYCRWIYYTYSFDPASFASRGFANYYEVILWDWSRAPVFSYWWFPVKDYFLLPHALHTPGLVLALFAAAFAGTVWGAMNLVRAERRSGNVAPD